VSQAKGKKLVKHSNLLSVDTEAILEEIRLIGDGIVDHIDVSASSTTKNGKHTNSN